MKKILLALFVLGVTACSSFAQTTKSSSDASKFSIGLDAGLPVGDASNYSSFAIGGSLKYDFSVATGAYLNLSAGYETFTGKNGSGSLNAIPVKAGVKFYFTGQGFYGEGQIGAAFLTASGAGNAFIYAPGLGYTLDSGVDIGLRYEAWSKTGTVSQIALRLAYGF